MGFMEDLKSFLDSPTEFTAKQAQEAAKKEAPAYYPSGNTGQAYLAVQRDYEAIQLQNTDLSVGNLPEVFAFLAERHIEFAVCKHGDVFVRTEDGLDKLEDGEWVVTTKVSEEHFTVAVYGDHFMEDFELKENDPVEEGGGAGYRTPKPYTATVGAEQTSRAFEDDDDEF